ncbi:GAF domain-containing protein [Actinoplanes sp. NPDC023714]|uniref:GAF domain-containing protein n=1 Tax=Actinoplanes sp. NPDC023714 TaxID=3154322 RepID=UPI0033EE3D79
MGARSAVDTAHALVEAARQTCATATAISSRSREIVRESRRQRARRWRRHVRDDLQTRWSEVLERAARLEALLADPAAAIASALLDAALTLSHATKGNVQLVDPESGGLRIVAQCGFEREFLDHFALVRAEDSACGVAFATVRTVHVRDVACSAIFEGRLAREVVLRAGVRAVRSIPLSTPDGRLIGMLSVHYPEPFEPGPVEQRLLEALAAAGARRLQR